MSRLPFQRFAAAATAHPDAVAMEAGGSIVHYGELTGLVARAASRIADLGLPRQSRIGLLGTKELATYVSYLAILSQGHVVVPLGPDHPAAHLRSVARLAALRCVVLDRAAYAVLAEALGIEVLDTRTILASPARAAPAGPGRPEDLAYILFTSGSTGQPKGVPVRNLSVAAYLDHVTARYELGPGARLSQTFALTFDPSVFDLLGSWTSGATLVVPAGQETLNPVGYVNRRGLTHWSSVPSLGVHARRLGNLTERAMPSLRWTLLLGEALPRGLAEAWQAAAPGSIIENVYGPTELTVTCTQFRLPRKTADWPDTGNGTVPIGTVYPGLEWILVDSGQVVAGEGELCVRGPQRIAGYLDPADDEGRFVRTAGDVVTAVPPGQRPRPDDWYRTGDRVRVRNGQLIHLGRVDRQVKIRGNRIELDQIEGALRGHGAVDEAAVIVVPDVQGDPQLHAVVTGDPALGEDLARHLRAVLPGYMVPAGYHWLARLPVNGSGKTDYRSLRESIGAMR